MSDHGGGMTDGRGWRWADELGQSPTLVDEAQYPTGYASYYWGTVSTDPHTGMPYVPEEGMFWRVSKSWGFWRVQLRKKLFIGSYKVAEAINDDFVPMTYTEILDAAAYALADYRGEFETENERRNRVRTQARKVTGDYYPSRRVVDRKGTE